MNIVCATDGNYLPHCAVMLATLAATQTNAADIRIYILLNNVNPGEFQRAIPYVYELWPNLAVQNADLSALASFPVSGHITRAAYIRLLLPSLLPAGISRVLFIDSDAVVCDDLQALWSIDLAGKAMAAVPEHWMSCRDHGYNHGGYFNSGVMLIDLDRWRQSDLLNRGAVFAHEHPDRLRHWDQDVLNHVFENDWLALDDRWNACPHLFGLLPGFSLSPNDLTRSEQEAIANPAIVHFAGPGPVKPWNARCTHPLRHLYLAARAQSPWAHEPLLDTPPPKIKQLWDRALFATKCQVRQLIGSK